MAELPGTAEPTFSVLWPLSQRADTDGGTAQRPTDLSGKTVAELWDMNFRGEVIYPLIRQRLAERFDGVKIVDYSNFDNFHGPRGQQVIDALPGKLSEHDCDAVIVGIGACGGCTPAVVRTAAMIEKIGIPTVSIVTTGFMKQAELVARGLGVPLSIVEYPGHPTVDSEEQLTDKVQKITAPALIDSFASRMETGGEVRDSEPEQGSIIFTGTYDEVQDHFHDQLWTDGLPVTPPTKSRVDAFLAFTDRAASDVLGVVPVEGREATIHSIAITGVMAGCRPEYMPVLVAAVEAMCDPVFRLQSVGTTPGWEPLMIVSGPIAEELGLHYGQGVMRVGNRANTSLGRFMRLFLRNICGYRIPPGAGDKASIGQSFLVALAEDEAAARDAGFPTYGEGRGAARDESIVTVRSVVAISPAIYSSGESAVDHVDEWKKVMVQAFSSWAPMDFKHGDGHYLLVVSPLLAKVVSGQWSKDHIRQYLVENAKMTAATAEHFGRSIGNKLFSLETLVEQGILPDRYHASTDPERLVDFFLSPDSIEILVAGDPDRNQSRAYMCNHNQGAPVSRTVRLPANWNELRRTESTPTPTKAKQDA